MSDSAAKSSDTLSTESRPVLKLVFFTLFLDLVGFSIIFPLFPSMLTYYMEQEGDTGLIGAVVSGLEQFTRLAGGPGDFGIVILFGGVLSALYSLLQFLFAPLIGSLSDRFGRRPVLLVSIAGIAVSYILWFFAGRFALLVLARVLGGIMAGNISTASAVVADVTDARNRSKGMAIIGIAFGLGFVIGPAIGGLSAGINLIEHWPSLAQYGVNPFSMPALAALCLSVVNLGYVAAKFTETRPKDLGASDRLRRSINPVALFRTEAYPGVTRTNLTNFLFLTAFSGMEFSLTFLAMDRLGYGPRQNALMFVFVGVTLAAVQGGYVRRWSAIIGPKRMSIHGLLLTIPGLVTIGLAESTALLYVGLFFMAVGSAQVIPCLTALASIYAPPEEQGRVLGVFRSLGALARALGPLCACVAYWQLGSAKAYFTGAAAIGLPLLMAAALPNSAPDSEPAKA